MTKCNDVVRGFMWVLLVLALRVFVSVGGVQLRISKAPYQIRSVMPSTSSATPLPRAHIDDRRRGLRTGAQARPLSQRCVQPSLLVPSRDHQHSERNLRAFRVIATGRHVYTDAHSEAKSMSYTSGSYTCVCGKQRACGASDPTVRACVYFHLSSSFH